MNGQVPCVLMIDSSWTHEGSSQVRIGPILCSIPRMLTKIKDKIVCCLSFFRPVQCVNPKVISNLHHLPPFSCMSFGYCHGWKSLALKSANLGYYYVDVYEDVPLKAILHLLVMSNFSVQKDHGVFSLWICFFIFLEDKDHETGLRQSTQVIQGQHVNGQTSELLKWHSEVMLSISPGMEPTQAASLFNTFLNGTFTPLYPFLLAWGEPSLCSTPVRKDELYCWLFAAGKVILVNCKRSHLPRSAVNCRNIQI